MSEARGLIKAVTQVAVKAAKATILLMTEATESGGHPCKVLDKPQQQICQKTE